MRDDEIIEGEGADEGYLPGEPPYSPARRPSDAPGGDRVRFEREGDHEQSIFGGSALDIEQSILADTKINAQILGRKISAVRTVKGDLGSGTLQEIVISLDNGGFLIIKGVGMTMAHGLGQ